MNLYERFELLEAPRGKSVRSFKARRVSTGQPVEVHLLVEGAEPILFRVARLPEEKSRCVLENGEENSTPFIVTEVLTGYNSFEDWLSSPVKANSKPADAAPIATPPSVPALPAGAIRSVSAVPVPAGPEPGEFTRMFLASKPEAAASSKSQPATPQADAPVPVQPAPTIGTQAGEFTTMFR